MQKLDWNRRTVIVRNAVVTNSITATEMAQQTWDIYRKVMDSNPWELMTDDMRSLLAALLKTGITGDRRWLTTTPVTIHDISQWRMLTCYAHQEQISEVVNRGLRVMSIEAPDIDAANTDCFMPDNYELPNSISSTIGNKFVSENERLMATFKLLKKLVSHRQLAIRHLVELDRELRQYSCEEELLEEKLKEQGLWKLASRTMQLMAERTGLTEGFMPVRPLNDRTTRQLLRQVDERLKI